MIAVCYDQVLPLQMYSQELSFGWDPCASVPCVEQELSTPLAQDAYLSDAHSIDSTAMSRQLYPVSLSPSMIYFP